MGDIGRLTSRDANGGIAVRDLPAALDKLASYEDAEEQERLVCLPVKAGITVYHVDCNARGKYYIEELELYGFTVNDGGVYEAILRDQFREISTISPYPANWRLYFLTCAEAEAALQARNAAQ